MRIRNIIYMVIPLSFLLMCILDSGDLPSFDYVVLSEQVFSDDTARILLFGDSGAEEGHQAEVAAGMAVRQDADPFDFAIMLGDNFYEKGVRSVTDPQFDNKFRFMYPVPKFNFPFYVVVGNHDHYGNAQAQYNYIDPEGRWISPGPAYILPLRFNDGRLIDIYFLDAEYLHDNQKGPEIRDWVEALMLTRNADLNMLTVHNPFYSSGKHGDDTVLQELFASLLSSGSIRIAISGHDHDLELQVHDKNADGKKELFIISGSASKKRSITAGPDAVYAASIYGFAELTLAPSGPSVSFFDENGNILYTY